mmetsp:Transcript_14114/g.18025  ORF Transcript_14114/g.18025 Transcript_14114/m.18025 type:complete len:107 (+) Transcript_14114:276-596(+)
MCWKGMGMEILQRLRQLWIGLGGEVGFLMRKLELWRGRLGGMNACMVLLLCLGMMYAKFVGTLATLLWIAFMDLDMHKGECLGGEEVLEPEEVDLLGEVEEVTDFE